MARCDTMELTDLPEEILLIIIQDLDMYTLESLYNTCQVLRNIICVFGVVRNCRLSCSVMATANKLKTNFFRDIAPHIINLNMCGVPDLCKTTFLQAIKKLKKLKVLDVSYTNIHIADLVDIHKFCPDLKDITINFTCCKCAKVSKNLMMQCQSVFEKVDNIHFVGSVTNLLNLKLALYLMEKSILKKLKYTIVEKSCISHIADQEYSGHTKLPHFDQFTVYLLNWHFDGYNYTVCNFNCLERAPVLSMLEIDKCEYIVISNKAFEIKVYASHIFTDFFKDNFSVTTQYFEFSQIPVSGNTAIMVWNKQTTNFGKDFYDTLIQDVKQYFPYNLSFENVSNVLADPAKRSWFYDLPDARAWTKDRKNQTSDRKRQATPSFVLDYDRIFKEKHRMELTLDFKFPVNTAISLSADSDYLSKLTYFSLRGVGRYSANFFNILFHCCQNLTTLNVETLPMSSCTLPISRSLPISTSLRNIRIVHKRVDMKTLFHTFSQCPKLENINVVDECEREFSKLADPSPIIEKCENLYSVYLEANLTESTKIKTTRMFNKAKAEFNKMHLNFTIHHFRLVHYYNYDPFLEVFKLSSVKPL